jgi:hypothetical protein
VPLDSPLVVHGRVGAICRMKRGAMGDGPLLFTQPFLWAEASDPSGAAADYAAADYAAGGAAHSEEAPTDGEGTLLRSHVARCRGGRSPRRSIVLSRIAARGGDLSHCCTRCRTAQSRCGRG